LATAHKHIGTDYEYLIFLLRDNSALCTIVKHTDCHVSVRPE